MRARPERAAARKYTLSLLAASRVSDLLRVRLDHLRVYSTIHINEVAAVMSKGPRGAAGGSPADPIWASAAHVGRTAAGRPKRPAELKLSM